MAGPTTKLLVAADGARAIIRPCGRATFACSADFKRLVYDLYERKCRDFVLELSGCTVMDSTFLGILVRFAGVLADGGEGDHRMTLWNPSPRIIDLLTSLGMVEFFRVEEGEAPGVACAEVEAPASGADKAESTKVALEAHETLMQVNPANVLRFKDVTKFLAEDLKRTEGAS